MTDIDANILSELVRKYKDYVEEAVKRKKFQPIGIKEFEDINKSL